MNRLLLIFIFTSLTGIVLGQVATAHKGKIYAVEFSPDNSLIVTGGEDRMVRGWDVRTGKNLFILPHKFPIKKLYISPDNKFLVTSDNVKEHCVWDLSRQVMVRCLSNNGITGFSQGGSSMISVRYEGNKKFQAFIHKLSLPDFQRTDLPSKEIADTAYVDFKISSDGKKLFFVSNRLLQVYSLPESKELLKVKLKENVKSIQVSPDERFVITYPFQGVIDIKRGIINTGWKDSINTDGEWFFDEQGALIQKQKSCFLFFSSDSFNAQGKLSIPDIAEQIALSRNRGMMAFTTEGNKLMLITDTSGYKWTELVGEDITEEIAFQNYLRGIYYYNEANYELAIRLFSLSEDKTKRADKLYMLRGDAYMQLREYDLAVKDYRKDCKLNGNRSLLNLARAYVKNQEYDLAMVCLNEYQHSDKKLRWKALASDPILTLMGQFPEWKAFLKEAEQNQTEADKLADVSEKMFKRKNYMAALEYINKALAYEPLATDWLYMRANIYNRLYEFDKAKKDYIEIAKIDSSQLGITYHGLAKSSALKGEMDKAVFWLKRAVTVDSSLFKYMVDIADIELSQYDRQQAGEILDEYLRMIPDDYYGYYLRATIRCTTNKCDDIERAIKLCKEQGKEVPKELYELQAALK